MRHNSAFGLYVSLLKVSQCSCKSSIAYDKTPYPCAKVQVGSSTVPSSSVASSASASSGSAAPTGTGCAYLGDRSFESVASKSMSDSPTGDLLEDVWQSQNPSTTGLLYAISIVGGGMETTWIALEMGQGHHRCVPSPPMTCQHSGVMVTRDLLAAHADKQGIVFRTILPGPVAPAALHFCLCEALLPHGRDKGR